MRRAVRLFVACCLAAAAVGCSSGTGAENTTADAGQALIRVPQDAATLTEAASRVAEGGTIVLAPGTIPSSYRSPRPMSRSVALIATHL